VSYAGIATLFDGKGCSGFSGGVGEVVTRGLFVLVLIGHGSLFIGYLFSSQLKPFTGFL